MQDKYAGDVGDFGKFALLRTLAAGQRLGVCWYLVENETASSDGKHRSYLAYPERFRELDRTVFDALKPLRDDAALRSVRSLEQLRLLPGTVFHGVPVPKQPGLRHAWFSAMKERLKKCGLLFLDPDNGVAGTRTTPKSVSHEEIRTLLADGHPLLVYHHQTRMRGGADTEANVVGKGLQGRGAVRVQAIRLRPYSSRFYFLIDGSDVLHTRLKDFARRWGQNVELFDEVG
jgi:hypothetical protein